MDHIIVPGLAELEQQWTFSHVVRHAGTLYLSGVTGTGADGDISADPAEQFERAFVHLRQYLAAAGATPSDVVEMTTYHVDLREHLTTFMAVKGRFISAPYPAWSAIGVAELITPGTLLEIRAVARDPRSRTPTRR